MRRLISAVKGSVVTSQEQPRRVIFGLYRGLRLNINLAKESQLLLGLAELETHYYIRKAAERASWVIDVGSGGGELSLYFASLPTTTRIFAIDPSAECHAKLHSNLELNLPLSKKICAFKKSAAIRTDDQHIRLDDLPIDRSKKGFIKVDVDGAELSVLQGAESLTHLSPDWLIETHSACLESHCIKILSAYGYRPLIVDNAWWRVLLPELRPIPHCRWLWAPGRDFPVVSPDFFPGT